MDDVKEFMACLSPAQREQVAALPAAKDEIARLLDQARAAWPEVVVAPGELARYLAERFPRPGEVEPMRALQNWHAADLVLACGCVSADAAAIAGFMRTYLPVIRATLRKLQLGAALAEDVEQTILRRLLVADDHGPCLLQRYSGLGRLSAWLRVVSSRIGRRMLEQEKMLVPTGDERLLDALAEPGKQLELAAAKGAYRAAFKQAFRRALGALEPRDALMLRQRYVDGLGLAQMGAIHRVHHTTIHRRLEALRAALFERTRLHLQEELGIGSADCESVMRMIQSTFEITLHTFLRVDALEPGGDPSC